MTQPAGRDRPIGIYEKALPAGSWAQMLDSARRAGFTFVEMSIDESDERLARLEWSDDERRNVRQAIQESGVPIYSICLSAHRRFGLGSADQDVRTKAARILELAIELAADLGVRVVQIAGYFAYYEPDDHDAYGRYVDGLREGLRHAAGHGVMLGIENIDTHDMASAEDAIALVEMLSSPWFRIYPDVGNFAVNGLDVPRNVTMVLPYSVGLHLKDARLGEPRRVGFGTGEVPFTSVFTELLQLGYTGPLTLEMWNDDASTALDTCREARSWVLERLRQVDQTAPASAGGVRT